MKRGLGVWEEPRELLKMTGADFVEMKDSDRCCGMAGAFGVKYNCGNCKAGLEKTMSSLTRKRFSSVSIACTSVLDWFWWHRY